MVHPHYGRRSWAPISNHRYGCLSEAATAEPNMPNSLPPHPWNRQQNEPAVDYQLFIAWLRLPPPRYLRQAASALKCSYYRLRTLCARSQWKTRARAYDNCRANAASEILDRTLSKESADFKRRTELFREQEWVLHEEMLAAASDAVARIRAVKRCPTIPEITRLLELAFLLGRRACGLPFKAEFPAFPPPVAQPDCKEALKKVYGESRQTQARCNAQGETRTPSR